MPRNKSLSEWSNEYMVCTTFAAEYKRANPEAVIKFGEVDGEEHAWVYDPVVDETVDATLGQFFIAGCEDDWWVGDEHPMADETAEYDDIETFAKEAGGNYLLEA